MNTPATYADWIPLLKRFSESADTDSEILPVLESGTISWSDGVAQKFANRCGDCLMVRLDLIQKKFNLDMQRSNGSLDSIVAATLSVRNRLKPLVRFTEIDGFPEELKTYLKENLKSSVNSMQEGLEDDLEEKAKHSTNYANILVSVRKNPIRLPSDEELKDDRKNENTFPVSESLLLTKKKKRLLF